MFILSSTSFVLEFLSTSHTSIYEKSELKFFKDIKFLDKVSCNWPNDLLGTNVYEILEYC